MQVPNKCSTPKIWQQAYCHCRSIQYQVLMAPLVPTSTVTSSQVQKVVSCNCSLCSRVGYLNVFPARDDVKVYVDGKEYNIESEGLKKAAGDRLGYYTRKDGSGIMSHTFCKGCGCSLWVGMNGPNPHKVSKEMMGEWSEVVAVNVRMFKNVDIDGLMVTVLDMKNHGAGKH